MHNKNALAKTRKAFCISAEVLFTCILPRVVINVSGIRRFVPSTCLFGVGIFCEAEGELTSLADFKMIFAVVFIIFHNG